MTLAEIEAHPYTRLDLQHDEEEVYLAQDVRLLFRAVRQLGRERKAYQIAWPGMIKAYDEMMRMPELESDILALLEEE